MSNSNIHHSISSEVKSSLSVSIPLIASQLILSMSGFIGTAMIAHVNKMALAASVLVNMIWWTLSVLFLGLLNSTSVLVSQQYGAKNYKAISEVMGQAFLLGALICTPVMLIIACSPFFLKWSNQSVEVLNYARIYFHSLLWCIPGLLLLIIQEQFLTGIGRTKLVLAISILEVPIEVALIYVLVFGKLGIPALGIAGVGYGFTLAFSLTAIVLAIYLYYSKSAKQFAIFAGIGKFNKTYFNELLRVGWPIGMMYLIEVGAFAVATFFIARFSSITLAAHQIAFQYLGVTINIVFGMAQTVTIRIGQAAGRNDAVGVNYAAFVGMLLSASIMFLIAIIYFACPHLLISLDIDTQQANNTQLIKQASMLLGIIGIFQLFENFRIIEVGALRGLKDTKIPMLVSFISFWLVGLVSAYIFGFNFNLGGAGVWWGLTLGMACGAMILFFRMRHILRNVDLQEVVQIN